MSLSAEQLDQLSWSLYWSQDQLQSCVSGQFEQGQAAIDDLWTAFAQQLQEGASVLDLATGNGAVPVALLKSNVGLEIDAVDAADIDPNAFLTDHPELRAVRFRANTDILELPFENHQFDAITSQFGIEYAGLEAATTKVIPLLAQRGRLGFLIHHEQSEILRSSARKLEELGALLTPDGLLETLERLLRGAVSFQDLEVAGQRYLDLESTKTDAITGQVFSGINQIAEMLRANPGDALKLGATLDLRLRAEQERLRQLKAAARSEEQFVSYLQLLEDLKMTNIQNNKITAEDALIGCFVSAQKT